MHQNVRRFVFVAALALAGASVTVRTQDRPEPQKPAASTKKEAPARAMASYRVDEDRFAGGTEIQGVNYRARVEESGFTFGQVPTAGARFAQREFTVRFGAPRVEQGGLQLDCAKGTFQKPAFGVAQIQRGAVTEEYVFENSRVEQLYRFPAKIGEGALRVRVPVTSDLDGPVVAIDPDRKDFKELQFAQGGLSFRDSKGATRLAYHSAIAIDADNKKIALAPRHENGEVILEVPAAYMAHAKYPLTIDPWLELGGSASGGGITNNNSVSDRPQIRVAGGLVFICWSDNSAAASTTPDNYDIYLKYWNGFEFIDFGGSSLAGGISANLGKSVNPSLSMEGANGNPVVAWQDDSNGPVCVFLRAWAGGTAGPWIEFGGSGTFGINGSLGPALNPSVDWLAIAILSNDPLIGTKFQNTPVIAWEENTATSEIYCAFFFPGAPTVPPTPAGWYYLGADGSNTDPTKRYPGRPVSLNTVAGVSQRPVLVVDAMNNINIAWQDSSTNNFEIYGRCWNNFTSSFSDGSMTVRSDGAILPPSTWTEFNVVGAGGSGSGGGISNTGTASQNVSMCSDLIFRDPLIPTTTCGLTVAWQETGNTSSQVFVKRAVYTNGAIPSFDVINAGDASGGGVSQSAGNATSPSVDVNGGYAAVAWADDSNVNTEIYVRRTLLAGGPWEQIGFQGSAAPLLGLDVIAPIDGVSKTATLSLFPSMRMDGFGSPSVAWSDGFGSTFDVYMIQFAPNGPGIAVGTTFTRTMRQTLTDPNAGPATDITLGGVTSNPIVWFSADMFTEVVSPAPLKMWLEVEVKPVGAAFQGKYTVKSNLADPFAVASVGFGGLPNTNYQWQARSSDDSGRVSPWFPFGPVNSTSFRINSAGGGPPPPPPVVTPSKAMTLCGLTGLEVVGFLGLARLLRRRFRK